MSDDYYEHPVIGRVLAAIAAAMLSYVLSVLMTAPDSPLQGALGEEFSTRIAHALAFWSVTLAVVMTPPYALLGYTIGMLYSFFLGALAAMVECTIRYVLTGIVFQPCPTSLWMFVVSSPIFAAMACAHLVRTVKLSGKPRREDWVTRLSLNPWIVLFGVACSAIGVLLTVAPPPMLWHLIGG